MIRPHITKNVQFTQDRDNTWDAAGKDNNIVAIYGLADGT